MIKIILNKISQTTRLLLFKKKWRKVNTNNFTTVKNIFPLEKVYVGKKTYGDLNVKTFGNSNEKLVIGSFCSIAGEVTFLLGGEHFYKGLSTYPFRKYVCNIKENTLTKGPIILKDDVWVGQGCLILSGVTIGQGAIIAAGSIVAKDIPPYAIFANNAIIKYRFSNDIISKLLKLDFSKLTEDSIKANIDFLYSDLDINTLENGLIKICKDIKSNLK